MEELYKNYPCNDATLAAWLGILYANLKAEFSYEVADRTINEVRDLDYANYLWNFYWLCKEKIDEQKGI